MTELINGQPLRTISPNLDLDYLLPIWGNWARARRKFHHCGSIEHRYRRNPRGEDTSPDWVDVQKSPIAPSVCDLEAMRVELVMRLLPAKYRRAFKLVYVDRMLYQVACRRVSVRQLEWDGFIAAARNSLSNLLTRQGKRDSLRKNSGKPAMPR